MSGWKLFLKETLSTLLTAILIAVVIKTFILDNRIIPSGSMLPTIQIGDMVLVNKMAYYWGTPERGDIIVFTPPAEVGDQDLIKRVIALPGETVEVRDGQVWIDGQPMGESYLNEAPLYSFGPLTVPEGSLFVLGDNRNDSFDGHRWPQPFLAAGAVKGKAFFRYWPLSRLGSLYSQEVRDENTVNQ